MATAAPAPASSRKISTSTTATSQPTTTTTTTIAVQRHAYTTVHTPEHTDFFHDRCLPLSAAAATAAERIPDAVLSTSNKVVQQGAASGSHSGHRDININAKSESGPSGARGIWASSLPSTSSAPYPSFPSSPLTPTSPPRGPNAVFPGSRESGRVRGSYWPSSTLASENEHGGADKEMEHKNGGEKDEDEIGFARRRLEPSSSLRSSAEDTLCGSSSPLSQKTKAALEEGPDDSGDEDYEEDYHHHHHSHFHRRHSKYFRALRAIQANVADFFKRNTGLLLVTASQVFLSLMNVAVKKLNGIDPPVPTLELVAVRMIITYICCMVYMLSTGVPDPYFGPKGVRLLLITRGSVGFFGLFGVYYSLQYLSLSDATVLTFLAPMCTAIAGALLLGEKFTKREAFAGIVSLVGVVLIARPTAIFGEPRDGVSHPESEKGTPQERLIAVGVALIGVLGATGAYTSIRAIGKRAHPLHSMVFFSAFCVLISTAGMISNKTPVVIPTRLDWLALLLMIGIFGFVAQTLLTMGLQRETAGRGSMAVYTQIVFATVLERIFFRAVPTALSVIGTVLIISSALYVALTKENEAKEDSKSSDIRLHRLPREDEELEEGLLNDRDSRLPPLGERSRGLDLEKPRS